MKMVRKSLKESNEGILDLRDNKSHITYPQLKIYCK